MQKHRPVNVQWRVTRVELYMDYGPANIITFEGRDGTKKTIPQKWCYMSLPFRHEECAQLRTCTVGALIMRPL